MRRPTLLAMLVALALAACGEDDEQAGAMPTEPADVPAETTVAETSTARAAARKKGTKIVVRKSEFGRMLFDSRKQAIYIFERDDEDTTRCYGECAELWPPVYAKGGPVAGKDVKTSLLGTIRRRDGRRQVTYDGQPLYFYAHEEPGEVRCHNVNLNGGLWWVVGPNGRRRP